jgi:hypothetical protein
MPERASRATLFGQVLLAHFIGLLVVGLYGSIGTTAGFGSGLDASLYIGWFLSLPWLAGLAFLIWRWGVWLTDHLWVLYLAGPPIVCVTSCPVFGTDFLPLIAMSSATSSVALLLVRIAAIAVPRLRGRRNSA